MCILEWLSQYRVVCRRGEGRVYQAGPWEGVDGIGGRDFGEGSSR